MPTLPLYDSDALPEAWHRVISPGGYEWWHFYAHDERADVRVIIDFFQGDPFDPEYVRRYLRYRKRPTRRPPPQPHDYPCVCCAVYEGARLTASWTRRFPAHAFCASDRLEVRIGDNYFRREGDCLVVHVSDGSAKKVFSGGISFAPTVRPAAHEAAFLSDALGGSLHRWTIADGVCEVTGEIRAAGRTLMLQGRGHHDSRYGTAPLGMGLSSWMHGKIFHAGTVLSFCVARSADESAAPEAHLFRTDAEGTRELHGEARVGWNRSGGPASAVDSLSFGNDLELSNPRMLERCGASTRLLYDASSGGKKCTALVQVIQTARLAHPLSRRWIGRSIWSYARENSKSAQPAPI